MSSNHKAPLAAFVVVAIACVVVLATNSMRSYARDAWRDFAAPVVSGLALLPSEHQKPATPVVTATSAAADVPVVSAGPALRTAVPLHRRGPHKARHAAGASTPAHHANTAQTASPVSAVAAPATPLPPATQSAGPGEHRGWSQGQHNGWAHAPHGGHGSTYGHTSGSHGNGWGKTQTKVVHGPSWKGTKSFAGADQGHAKATSVAAGHPSGHNGHAYGSTRSHGNHGHGFGNGGRGNNGRGH